MFSHARECVSQWGEERHFTAGEGVGEPIRTTERKHGKDAGGLQRDVVYLGWPIAPSYMSPNAGGGGEGRDLQGLSPWAQLYTGA